MIHEKNIDAAIESMFLKSYFPTDPCGLYDPLRYIMSIGGKRIRPRLCLTTYSLFKDEFSDEVLIPAAGLEVFHSFTLLHDDIMDKADMRRGVPTVHKKWNDNTAILSGDVMSIESYKMIAMVPERYLAKALNLFSTTAAEVCEGQQLDMDFESEVSVPMSDYMKMIGLKTAVLIACAAKLGALVAGASDQDCDSLYRYGYSLGLAFQITDDYLDTFGDSAVFGKNIGGDIVNNKKSWLMTKAFENGYSAELEEAMKLPVGSQAEQDIKIALVRDIYIKAGVDTQAKEEINRLHNEAMAEVESLNISKVKMEMLSRYALNLCGRNK